MYTVLVCDDDEAILKSVEIYLKMEGYEVLTAHNGLEAVEMLQTHTAHCVVLDIMMPELDGIGAMLSIRKTQSIPIILLSAKSEDTDKISGLGFGADDYVTKPFNPLELTARVKSQIRRYCSLGNMVERKGVIITGGLCLDTEAHLLTLDGEEIKLTATEYGIVEYLMEHLGQTIPTSRIYEAVWGEPSFEGDKTVTVHIRRIREKMEINPKEPKYLKVVWGIGYKIEKY